tara:strand:+ start:14423 stop:14692 length:270 start_codon:yes stop_codon:yes gene_type:complete
MIVKLVELKQAGGTANLQEVFINTEQVVCVKQSNVRIDESVLPQGLNNGTEFSNIYLDHGQSGMILTVVGPPGLIETKINSAKKQLLKG